MGKYSDSFANKVFEKRGTVAVFFVLCVIVGAVFGYFQANKSTLITDAEKEEIRIYQDSLEKYDETVEELKKSIAETEQRISEQRQYVDNSIYMKLDPSSIEQVSVQYILKFAKKTDSDAVKKAILSFINEGGLQNSINESDGLETEYWWEVLNASVSGKVLMITLMHYDSAMADQIMDMVNEELRKQVEVIASAEGDFSMEEIKTWHFEKSASGILNNQNKSRSSLRSYYSTKAGLQKKLNSILAKREKYRTGSIPKALQPTGTDGFYTVMAWVLAGVLAAFLVSIVYIWCLIMLQRKDRSL